MSNERLNTTSIGLSESEDSLECRPRVIVAQLGARRHYLVPATFYSEGLLTRFFTDLYLGTTTGRLASIAKQLLPVGPLRRLSGRQDQDLPTRLVESFPLFALRSRLNSRLKRGRGQQTDAWLWSGRTFGKLVSDRGLDGCDAVYAYSSAALEIFETARKQGKLCILDHATAPKRFEDNLTMRQAERYPGWSSAPPCDDRWADEYADRQSREAALADLIICGSTFVKDAVESASGQRDKCVVVPLGIRRLPTAAPPKAPNVNRRLRVLFVGDECIRKGIGDFYTAVRDLGVDRCEARVAGNLDLSAVGRSAVNGTLKLLGAVPREEMSRQYQWADVCVLPSVSDTFGLVILEALSFGVPVITTPNTGGGDVITEGVNGFIVPVMAPEEITQRLETLYTDPNRLPELSEAAILRSHEFGLATYAKRLVTSIKSCYQSSLANPPSITSSLS